MLNYIKPLATLNFWFKLAPDPLLPVFYYGFVVFFSLLVFASVVCGLIYSKERERYVLRYGAKYLKNWLLAAGITGYLFLFFNYERAVFLSARFWYVVWALAFGTWLIFVIKKIKRLPAKQTQLHKQARFEKYLPKKK